MGRTHPFAWCLLAAATGLVACTDEPSTESPSAVTRVAHLVSAGTLTPASALIAKPELSVNSPYLLTIFQDRAVYRVGDWIEARPGSGYPTLRAFIYARGVPRKASPVAEVKPVCRTARECEYLPSRKGKYADRYTISVEGDDAVELRAEKDEILIAARSLRFAQTTPVTVTLTVPGEPASTMRLLYAAGS